MSCDLLGARRHKTDGRFPYCPDLSNPQAYFECKAVGTSREVFIYSGRLLKDRLFAAEHSLLYLIWHHGVKVKGITTVAELECVLRANVRSVYLVPFSVIDRVCSVLPVESLNSKYGKRPGTEGAYGSGYRFHLRLLSRWGICL